MKFLRPVFKNLSHPLTPLLVYLKQKAGWLKVPVIVPYHGFGNESDVYIKGMVMEDKGIQEPHNGHRKWRNVLSMIKRFASDEIAGVKLSACFMGITLEGQTDEQGYFSFHFHFEAPLEAIREKQWHEVHFKLLDELVENQPEIKATGEVRIILNDNERIFVSDIDDTVLISHSTQILRKMRLLLIKNAHTRLPFPGVSLLYKAFKEGDGRSNKYPFFYVSSSEWNLYDLLDDFFTFNKIPKGVFMLRKLNYSIYKFWKSGGGSHEHKFEKIKFLLDFYPNHEFVLIGDSGQCDPVIYKRIVSEYPDRVRLIYIRKVKRGQKTAKLHRIIEHVGQLDTTMVLAPSTAEVAQHAAGEHYIDESYLRQIDDLLREAEKP
ncbi:App1 family protein [Roseimarinus sediminis]|jgi:phosphatidate phosphatase APP1|uniref:App1 family protein n=1 Tax=Roseimarinus sediminis TaxID=1610899 RepID=UPI003D233EFC